MNEKFQKLTEKISKLSNKEIHTPAKVTKLELKLDSMEDLYNSSIENLDSKYQILREHINKLKKSAEEERDNKDDIKQIYQNELKQIESNIKSTLVDEREYMKIYSENLYNKIENMILNISKSSIKDNEDIKNSISLLKDHIQIDLPALKAKSDNVNEESNKNLDQIINNMNDEFNKINDILKINTKQNEDNENNINSSLRGIMMKVKEEFETEKNHLIKFEDSIIKLLSETADQLAHIK